MSSHQISVISLSTQKKWTGGVEQKRNILVWKPHVSQDPATWFILNQVTSVYTLPCCCNMFSHLHLGFPSSFFLAGFFYQNVLCISLLCIFFTPRNSVGCYRSHSAINSYSTVFYLHKVLCFISIGIAKYMQNIVFLHRTFTVLLLLSLWPGMFLLILSLAVFHVYWIPYFS
jgi:hypothetical protein